MIDFYHFRVAAYSASTSHFTAHIDHANSLHQFLEAAGVRVEPMVEASGTILRCYADENGTIHMDSEIAIVTFIADATPTLLHPILLRWQEALRASATPENAAAA